MPKEIIEVPVLSETIRKLGVPLSLVTRANGIIYVSGLPPLDLKTGQLVRGDIEVQTDASLKAVKLCLETAGSSLEQALMVRVYARYFPKDPPSRTFVPVASWPMEFDIEIDCTALMRA